MSSMPIISFSIACKVVPIYCSQATKPGFFQECGAQVSPALFSSLLIPFVLFKLSKNEIDGYDKLQSLQVLICQELWLVTSVIQISVRSDWAPNVKQLSVTGVTWMSTIMRFTCKALCLYKICQFLSLQLHCFSKFWKS